MTNAVATGEALVEGRSHVRVLVVHPEELILHGFRLILAGQGWSERCLLARGPAPALELARRFEPHVAIVDASLAFDPPEWRHELRRVSPHTAVLLLTETATTPTTSVRALGAAGSVCRGLPSSELLDAVRLVATGRSLPHDMSVRSPLSARQEEILQLLAHGATNIEIAGKLYLSRHTVKQHTSALYRKLNVRNRAQAVQTGQRLGLIMR